MKKNKRKSLFLISLVLIISMFSQVAFANTDIKDDYLSEHQTYENPEEIRNPFKEELVRSSLTFKDNFEEETLFKIENELEEDNINLKKHNFTDKDIYNINIPSDITFAEKNTRAVGNNDPNSAIYIDSSLFEYWLSNDADNNNDWYFFELEGNNKVTILLDQPVNGDYDIYLYELNGSTLNFVSYSLYSGSTMEQLSYISNSGYYFLEIVPYNIASANSQYEFVILTSSSYDSKEPDDNVSFANQYSRSINTNQTIDNIFDEDWFELNLVSDGTYDVVLNNVPNGAQYAVILYDKNLNTLGSFLSSGNEKRYWGLYSGSYYIRIFSYNGQFSTSQSYNFQLSAHEGYITTSPKGNVFEIKDNKAYVDGRYIPIEWSTTSRLPLSGMPYTTRTQKLGSLNNGIKVMNNYAVGSSLSGYTANGDYLVKVYSDNVIQIAATDLYYYYYRSPNADFTIPSYTESWTIDVAQ